MMGPKQAWLSSFISRPGLFSPPRGEAEAIYAIAIYLIVWNANELPVAGEWPFPCFWWLEL
jgi:hypothetical protein